MTTLIPLSFDTSKKHYDQMKYSSMHVVHFLPLGSDSPFGNLQLIFANVLQHIEHINKRIIEAYDLYKIVHADPMEQTSKGIKISDHQRSVEEVVYWMRRVADRLISLHWLIYQKNKKGEYPNEISVDCIGGLKKETSDTELIEFQNKYKKNIKFLDFLNGTSNAYKHSLINDESPSLRVGQNEPLVISLSVRKNNLSNKQLYKHDSLYNVIIGFIDFYKEIRIKIEEELK